MIAIIPAAGYATRLGELTSNQPKHFLEVDDKKLIDHVLSGIQNLPVKEIYLATNHKFYSHFQAWAEKLPSHIKLTVIDDQTQSNDDRLGAVGDIWLVIKHFNINDDLLIVAGDNLYHQDQKGYNIKPIYDEFIRLGKTKAVNSLFDTHSLEIAKHNNQMTFIDGQEPGIGQSKQIVKMVEKDPHPTSTLVATFIEIYPKSAIQHIQDYINLTHNHDKMGDFRGWLLVEKRVDIHGYHLPGKWFDIGLPQELKNARKFYNSLD